MELKVWLDGVARVVCGLSLDTSCQDVVIALAQSVGQTGRYVLVMELRGNETQLLADDRPLQHVAGLGQRAAEVRFILRRTGPSLSEGHERPEPPLPSRARSSPEPASKGEMFRVVLQQQKTLQDLEEGVRALGRETELLDRLTPPAGVPSVDLREELQELERRHLQNKEELILAEQWEELLRAETGRGADVSGRLQQARSALDRRTHQLEQLRTRAAHLEQEVALAVQRRSSYTRQSEEALQRLRQEFSSRQQQTQQLAASLSASQRELRAAEQLLQERWGLLQALNKQLRQCNLQQFIRQTGGPHADHAHGHAHSSVEMGQAYSHTDTEVTLQNIQGLYRKFTSECPSGKMHLHEFKNIFGGNSTTTEEESAYMENVFRSFDTNKDGKIDFMEYVAAVNLVLRGKLEDKLKWSFKVYDRDKNGCLDREEIRHVVKIIYKIKKHRNPDMAENTDHICDRVFEVMDKNEDSQISLEEFIEGAKRDPWVMDQLQLDIIPCDWFMQHQKKKS